MTEALNLLSLNVRGISNFKKRRTIFTWCRKRADISFLQETQNEWGAELITRHGSSNSCGVAILIKKDVDCTIHQNFFDPLGRYIVLKAEIKDKMYVLINVYAPNKDKNIVAFPNKLLITALNEDLDCESNIIIGGDFNCPLNPAIDKKGGILNENP